VEVFHVPAIGFQPGNTVEDAAAPEIADAWAVGDAMVLLHGNFPWKRAGEHALRVGAVGPAL